MFDDGIFLKFHLKDPFKFASMLFKNISFVSVLNHVIC